MATCTVPLVSLTIRRFSVPVVRVGYTRNCSGVAWLVSTAAEAFVTAALAAAAIVHSLHGDPLGFFTQEGEATTVTDVTASGFTAVGTGKSQEWADSSTTS